jgi:hypothetical protein
MKSLSPRLENLLITYQYWSDRYSSSSLTHDHKKKAEALLRFKEEARKAGITEEEVAQILETSQHE